MENLLRQRLIRSMSQILRSINPQAIRDDISRDEILDDRSLCFVVLWERGFTAYVLNQYMDAARCMARIRLVNEARHERS